MHYARLANSPRQQRVRGFKRLRQFVRAGERPHIVFRRLTGPEDSIEQFGVFELALPLGDHPNLVRWLTEQVEPLPSWQKTWVGEGFTTQRASPDTPANATTH